jgi:excisionase family DNA binding protein
MSIAAVQSQTSLEPLLSIEEASAILGRSHWTLRKDVSAGLIHCVRIGRKIMIDASEVRRIIDEGLKTA